MKKGTIAIFIGGIVFVAFGFMFILSGLISGSSINPASGIFGLVMLSIGIVVIIGGYYDRKRIPKQDKLLKKDWGAW